MGDLPLNELAIYLGLATGASLALWFGRPRAGWHSMTLALVITGLADLAVVKFLY
jgi:hypothetical protein